MAAHLSAAQATKLIREALGGNGELEIHPHADEGLEDDGFDRNDLRNSIRFGHVSTTEPEFLTGEDRFTLIGPSLETPPRDLGIVFMIACMDPVKALIISAFDESKRYGRTRFRH